MPGYRARDIATYLVRRMKCHDLQFLYLAGFRHAHSQHYRRQRLIIVHYLAHGRATHALLPRKLERDYSGMPPDAI